MIGWLPIWGSAADTIVEHPTEAEARLQEQSGTTTVHRWPSGPWIQDDGQVWDGDPQADLIRLRHEETLRAFGWTAPEPFISPELEAALKAVPLIDPNERRAPT